MSIASWVAMTMQVAFVATAWWIVNRMGKVTELKEELNTVRMASYELHTSAQDDIADLQDSLKAHGIPLSREHFQRRMARKAMTPEESKAEFDRVCEEAIALSNKLREERT
jgi:nitrate/nitrite-specific signal transduction histidine kinase